MLTQRSPLIAGSELGVVLTPSRRTLNPVGALRGGWADWDNYVLSVEPAGGNSRSYEGARPAGRFVALCGVVVAVLAVVTALLSV